MGVGGASRLFRDFVEKLERAYIAFDGVVGSCLGRAWGGPPTTTWTTTLTLFRETQNPISQTRLILSFFLPFSCRRLPLLFLLFVLCEQFPSSLYRFYSLPSSSLSSQISRRRTNRSFDSSFMCITFIYKLKTFLFLFFFSFFLLISHFDPLHIFSSSRTPVVGLDINSGMGKCLQ